MKIKDGAFYWLILQRSPEGDPESLIAQAVHGAGWQLPGENYSLPFDNPSVVKIGPEVVRGD